MQSVGISLQFTSFDFVFSSLYRKSVQKVTKDWRDKQVSDKEFHAGLRLVHQILLLVKAMAACGGADAES